MFVIDDRLDFETTEAPQPVRKASHYIFAALMFVAAYFTTITVNAQPQDAMSFGQNELASVTGTVKEADENWVIVTTAGKDMRIMLDDVDLNTEADEVFKPGMSVSVEGRMNGESFGVPVMEAKNITATAPQKIEGDARGGVLAEQQ